MDQQAFRQCDDILEWMNSLSFDDSMPLWDRFLRVRRQLPESEQRQFVNAVHRHLKRERFSQLAGKFDEFLIEWEALV